MRSAKTIEDCLPSGAAIMFELLAIIHCSAFPLMRFLSNSDWKRCGNFTDSDLKASRADVMEAEDK